MYIYHNIYHILSDSNQAPELLPCPLRHAVNVCGDFAEKIGGRDQTEFRILIRNHHQAIAGRWYSGLITCLVDNAHPR